MYYEDLNKKKNRTSPYVNGAYDNRPVNDGDGNAQYGALSESAGDREFYSNTLSNINSMKLGNEQLRNNSPLFNNSTSKDKFDISYRFTGGRWSPEIEEAHRKIEDATSPEKVKNRVNNYYDSYVATVFNSEKAAAEQRAKEQYKKHASYVGFNPHTAMGAADAEVAPERVINSTLNNIDKDALVAHFTPYAETVGMSGDEYVSGVVMPMLSDRLYEEYVKESTPKSSAEYILRSAYSNSLMGMMNNMGRNAYSGTRTRSMIESESMGRYNGSRLENFVAGVGSLLIDSPIFSVLGTGASAVAGRMTSMLTKNMVANCVRRGVGGVASKEAAKQYVKKYMKDNIVSQIMNSGVSQGLTLGSYNLAQSVASDIMYNEGIDWKNAAQSFVHGAGTGMMLGVVGAPLKKASSNLTGYAKKAADAGVLSAEALVFTVGTELEKIKNEVEIAPIDLFYDYMESAATLGVMRATHWRPKGADRKLDKRGTLHSGLRFSMAEQKEMREAGVNPENFTRNVEDALKSGSAGEVSPNVKSMVEDYVKLMADGNLSASARSKLMYIVEDKLTSSAPKPVDCRIETKEDGSAVVATFDIDGRPVQNIEFDTKFAAENYMITNKGGMRQNKLQTYIDMLSQKINTKNFFRQANEYSKETGVSPEEISEAMYKRANKEDITEREADILNGILQRSAYTPDELTLLLRNARREVENKYGYFDGTIEKSLNSPFYYLTDNQNRAVEEYVGLVEGMVRDAEKGLPLERSFEEVKSLHFPDERYIMNDSDSPMNKYVISATNKVHTKEDIKAMKVEGEEFAKILGTEVVFLSHPKEIKRSESYFGSKKMAMGWYDNVNDRVSIYLPNINDAAQMKRIMLHEVVGHKGLHDLFGLHTADFMEEVYEKADNDVRDKIKEIQKQFEYRDPYTAVEEYLATLNEKVNLTPKERTLLEGFKDFVREMLVRLNLYGEKKVLNEQDLVDIMQKHYESVLRRSSAGSHRRQAFGGFRNARYGEKSYTDLETNIRHFKKRNKDLNFENVDEFFRDTKKKELGQLNFRFIGERGLENLNYSGNRNYDDLKIAKQLETNGVDADYIRQKTGWERGWDNKWRYEISENSMFVKDPLRALNDEYTPNGTVSGDVAVPLADRLADYKAKYNLSPDRNPLRLRHLVDDDVFFGAYPELAYIRIEPRSGERGICRYDAKQRILYFDDSKIHTNEFRGELAGCMQRMIQDYEDFARAFDLHDSEVKPSYHDALKKVEELRRYKHIPNFEREHEYMQKEFIEEFGVPYHAFEGVFPSENEYNIYKETDNIKSLTGWDEVRNVKRRMSYKDSDRRNTPAWTTEDYEFDEQIPAVNFEDIEAKLDGPIDRLMRILKRNDTDKMMYFQKRISLDYVDPRLSPGQENRYKQYMREWINDNYRRNSREYRDGLREHRYEYEIDPEGFLNKN